MPFDRERASRVLAEAAYATDKSVAKRNSTTTRSIENWRQRMATDDVLADMYRTKVALLDGDWATAAVDFLRTGIEKLQQLVDQAQPDQIHEVAGAIKIVGELQVVRETLRGQHSGATDPDRGSAAPGRGLRLAT